MSPCVSHSCVCSFESNLKSKTCILLPFRTHHSTALAMLAEEKQDVCESRGVSVAIIAILLLCAAATAACTVSFTILQWAQFDYFKENNYRLGNMPFTK